MHKSLPLFEASELRAVQMNDVKALFKVIAANRKFLATWFDWAKETKTLGDTRLFVEESIKKSQFNRAFDAGIWSQGELCGMIGFHEIDWHHRIVEVGYWLAEPYQGKGLVTRALQVMMLQAFKELSLNRVEVVCALNNHKSRAVAERLGFTFEGIQREGQILHGRAVDEAVYSFLKRDYLAQPSLLEKPLLRQKATPREEKIAC